jgi:hypothetical protein
MVAYLIVACFLNWLRHRSIHDPGKELINQLFDAATFAGSVLVISGVFYQPILVLIGDTKPFLLVAGGAGILYPIGALFPKPQKVPNAKARRQNGGR